MKKILSAAAVALLVLGIGYKISQDPEIQKLLPRNTNVSTANTAERWANALCHKDAQALFDNSGGAIAMPIEEVQSELTRFPDTCAGVRYLGVVNSLRGPEYFFAFDIGRYEVWYGLTVEDGKVVGVE